MFKLQGTRLNKTDIEEIKISGKFNTICPIIEEYLNDGTLVEVEVIDTEVNATYHIEDNIDYSEFIDTYYELPEKKEGLV